MATFSISMSVSVEADSFDEAYAIQRALFDKIAALTPVQDGPYEIDVELIDGEVDEDEYDGQPDEAQEWNDFDPDC